MLIVIFILLYFLFGTFFLDLEVEDRLELPLEQRFVNFVASDLEHLDLADHVEHALLFGHLLVEEVLFALLGI